MYVCLSWHPPCASNQRGRSIHTSPTTHPTPTVALTYPSAHRSAASGPHAPPTRSHPRPVRTPPPGDFSLAFPCPAHPGRPSPAHIHHPVLPGPSPHCQAGPPNHHLTPSPPLSSPLQCLQWEAPSTCGRSHCSLTLKPRHSPFIAQPPSARLTPAHQPSLAPGLVHPSTWTRMSLSLLTCTETRSFSTRMARPAPLRQLTPPPRLGFYSPAHVLRPT